MVTLQVNGQERSFDGDPSMPLLWYLRDELGLTGTKFGCGQALCGACTVHVNGEAVRACITAVGDIGGQKVTTIEGLDPAGNHRVQKAWREAYSWSAMTSRLWTSPADRSVLIAANLGYRYYAMRLHQFYTCDWFAASA